MPQPSTSISATPEPAYYAVIFTSIRTDKDDAGYAAMAKAMSELAAKQPGWLGQESDRDGIGITVSYWKDLDSIAAWKAVVEHMAAQRMARERWYSSYRTRIAMVERDYGYEAP